MIDRADKLTLLIILLIMFAAIISFILAHIIVNSGSWMLYAALGICSYSFGNCSAELFRTIRYIRAIRDDEDEIC